MVIRVPRGGGTWRDELAELKARGANVEAVALLERVSDEGSAEARALLAREYFCDGRHKEAALALELCERQVDDDPWTHWYMYTAYFLGVGPRGYIEKRLRGIRHLEIAAEGSRIPQMLMEIAGYYEVGAHGLTADLSAAEAWLSKAAETGNEEAVRRHGRILNKLKYAKRKRPTSEPGT